MQLYIKKYSHIRNQSASLNGNPVSQPANIENGKYLTALYRSMEIDYPKFFKMDNLCKLGFLASELIFKEEKDRFIPREDTAVLCFNRSSSLETDTLFQTTIQQEEAYFPSPSVFVYTLPNIVTGEIAIRNQFRGETSFYVSEKFDAEQIRRTTEFAFRDKKTTSVLAAWIESFEGTQEAFMMWIEPDIKDGIPFSAEQIQSLNFK